MPELEDKTKAKFGEYEVHNPRYMKDIYKELKEMIKENSKQIELKDGMFDIQIDNTVQIMRYMLMNITNVVCWNGLTDDEMFEDTVSEANGDLKQVVDYLLDMMVEIAQDIRKENVRKLKLVENRIIELAETFKFNNNVNEKLKEFGIDSNTILEIQNLLSQGNLIEESK